MPEAIRDQSTSITLKINSDGSINISDAGRIKRITYTSDGYEEYIGEAIPGTLGSTAGWKIQKMSYSNDRVNTIYYAGSTATFTKVWNNRASYNYG